MLAFDETEVRKTLQVLKPNNQIFEIRILYPGSKNVYSGYFRDADTLIPELKKIKQDNCGIYISIQGLVESCYAKTQRDKLLSNTKSTTSDADVEGYDWLMIDFDPKRPTDTSSSDEELSKAREKANKVFSFLKQMGFTEPVAAESGNGFHLLYRVNLMNTEEMKTLMQNCLKTLNLIFSDSAVDIDRSNFNPSRVCKLYGTKAQKGSDTPERPHRMSRIIRAPKELIPTDKAYLEKLCSYYPKEEKPQQYNNYRPSEFDLEEWLNKYGLRYQKSETDSCTKYYLDECPFDSNHKGKDACIFRMKNGAIGFHCFHNSCADKTWRDVRMKYEPDAYEKENREWDRRAYRTFNRDKKEPVKIEPKEGVPVFETPSYIFNLPKVEEVFVKTGISEIDEKLRGLKKGCVSVVSGLRGSAKSTMLSQWAINAINEGNKVGFYSGELSDKNFMRWMYLQTAGKSHTENGRYPGYYNVPRTVQEKITKWMDGKIFLYNNAYGNNYKAIMNQFKTEIKEQKLDLLVLDNLMAFNIADLADTKWDAQTQFVLGLEKIAKDYDVHICFVAHPRKAVGFLRFDDISGSADLGNAVDYAFIVHRNNQDFRRLSKEMFKWTDDNEVYGGTNVIEIAKDRDGGTQDVFVPLYYEPESKRLKNNNAENRMYGWETDVNPFT